MAHPTYNPNDENANAIKAAFETGNADLARLFLEFPGMNHANIMRHIEAIKTPEVLKMVLAHPAFDPGRVNWVDALRSHVYHGPQPDTLGLTSRIIHGGGDIELYEPTNEVHCLRYSQRSPWRSCHPSVILSFPLAIVRNFSLMKSSSVSG